MDVEAFRQQLAVAPPDQVARRLLNCRLESTIDGRTVSVRLTEVEAYDGPNDPASHAFRGETPRNAVMFGPAGFLYVYFVYGMHWCANVSSGPEGRPSAVLLRAGEVVNGVATARQRRPAARNDVDLARGPARLASCLGLTAVVNGADLLDPTSSVRLMPGTPVLDIAEGPRVGVSVAADVPWRFWVLGEPSVSTFRAGTRRNRAGNSNAGG